MTSLAWLIPAALVLGGLGLAAFLWSLRSGQYEDLDGAAWRALQDRDAARSEANRATTGTTAEAAAPGQARDQTGDQA